MKLSVLDQAPVTKGNSAPDAIQKAIELGVLADELGYERMWMAEHHNGKTFASSAPEITAAYLAAQTKNIRVGTGGVMMMHYSPLKMAETFNTLSALAPGRIDFGVGRAPGGDTYSVYALSQGQQPDVYHLYEKMETTLQLIEGEKPADRLYSQTIAAPHEIVLPEAWMLGSSGSSAIQAGKLGVGYSFAQFFNGQLSEEIIEAYKKEFVPSNFMEKPEVMVSYMVTVAETKEEAEYEARPQDLARLFLQSGKPPFTLTPEEAKDYPISSIDQIKIDNNRRAGLHLVGTAEEVADKLQAEQAKYGFDEAMICSIPHTQASRLKVYRLLAEQLL
ncbi:MAG TPA: LLM class flavin-dependent oxidoreductase [Pseudogracilibacillus sp.]|nr:LLM class flavin-dependent oxidoreductase [Pseudogracilibacillus sp.]